MRFLFILIVGFLCVNATAKLIVSESESSSNIIVYNKTKQAFESYLKAEITNGNSYLRYLDLVKLIDRSKFHWKLTQRIVLKLVWNQVKPNINEIPEEFCAKFEEDLNDIQLKLDKLWIFYSEAAHDYNIFMNNALGELFIKPAELEDVHIEAKSKAIEQFQKNTKIENVFKLSFQYRLEHTIEEQYLQFKHRNDRLFTEQNAFHNHKIIAEMKETFEDELASEIPDINHWDLKRKIEKTLEEFDAKKLGDTDTSDNFREILNKDLYNIIKRFLFLLAKTGNDEVVDVLANVANDFNLKPEVDDALIFIAAREGYDNVVKSLIKHGVDVNIKNSYGNTPIFEAGNEKVVETLIKNRADLNIRNNKRLTPLQSAYNNGYRRIAEILRRNGGDKSVRNSRRNAILNRRFEEKQRTRSLRVSKADEN